MKEKGNYFPTVTDNKLSLNMGKNPQMKINEAISLLILTNTTVLDNDICKHFSNTVYPASVQVIQRHLCAQ
jgi:hypothetical protein